MDVFIVTKSGKLIEMNDVYSIRLLHIEDEIIVFNFGSEFKSFSQSEIESIEVFY